MELNVETREEAEELLKALGIMSPKAEMTEDGPKFLARNRVALPQGEFIIQSALLWVEGWAYHILPANEATEIAAYASEGYLEQHGQFKD